MGFAASQARFLSLTSRLSDKEYEAQQISQQRLALSAQMEMYSDEYSELTTNEILFAEVYDMNTNSSSKVALTYDVITKPALEGGLGLNLMTSSGQLVVSDREEIDTIIQQYKDNGSQIELTAEDFYVFKEVRDSSVLQKNLEDGNFYFASAKSTQEDRSDGYFHKKGYETLNNVTMNYDKSDDAAAKARYDKRMSKAERTDAMLEMRLDQIETEHKAIETEMEAVQKVVDDNVENSFKTFS